VLLRRTIMDALGHHIITDYGPVGLFVLLMFGIVGLPVPDETLMVGAGILIRSGELSPVPTFVAALLGSVSGITVSFLLGVHVGAKLLEKYGVWLHVSPARFARFQSWYNRHGRWALMIGYFVPGVRHVLAIAAGICGLPWLQFALFAYSGALLWVATFLVGGYFVGEAWLAGSRRVHWIMLSVGGLLVLAAAAHFVVRWCMRKKMR
jgi:membrane protein DedA with SNARE-associated domain